MNKNFARFTFAGWGFIISFLIYLSFGADNINPLTFIFSATPFLLGLFGAFISKEW